jgi:hypothetical protein
MSKKLIFIIVIVVVLIIGLIVGAFSSTSHPAQTTPSSVVTFPVSNTPLPNPSSSSKITVTAQDGSAVPVTDFIHNGQTISDPENKGNYLLAGSLGYCLPNMKCTAAPSTDFNILYDDNAKSFTIGLLKEPLSKSRTEAEQFLQNQLGITQQQMCNLNYYLGTTYQVNETYDSSNLGFSFCPGAVKLP